MVTGRSGAVELEDRGVLAIQHVGYHADFYAATIACIGDETPVGGCSGLHVDQIGCVEWRDETISIDPGTDALGHYMPIHRHLRVEIRAEDTVVFGVDASQIQTNPGHAAPTIGQQDRGILRIRRNGRQFSRG